MFVSCEGWIWWELICLCEELYVEYEVYSELLMWYWLWIGDVNEMFFVFYVVDNIGCEECVYDIYSWLLKDWIIFLGM